MVTMTTSNHRHQLRIVDRVDLFHNIGNNTVFVKVDILKISSFYKSMHHCFTVL